MVKVFAISVVRKEDMKEQFVVENVILMFAMNATINIKIEDN